MAKKKTSNRFIYFFSITLVVLAIALALYPIIGNFFAQQKRSTAVADYNQRIAKMTKAHLKADTLKARQFNQILYQNQTNPMSAQPLPKLYTKKSEVMGLLDIPAIAMKGMPFFNGDDAQTLGKGLGHMPNTSIPVGGTNTRAVITGHSGVENQVLFSEINTLKKGDIFYVTMLNQKRAYQIESLKVVLPTNTHAVDIKAGKEYVTLLTCTPIGINTHRLLVTGKRVPLKHAAKQKVTRRNWFDYQHVVFYLLILLVISLLMRWWLKKRKQHA